MVEDGAPDSLRVLTGEVGGVESTTTFLPLSEV
jgi:hypothetical protein